MSLKDLNANEQRKNNSAKNMNPNNELNDKNTQESPNEDYNNEEEKPVHFKIEYDKNKYIENQIESSPENNKNNIDSKSPSGQKEQQEFIIEKNNQTNENQNNVDENLNNPEVYPENNDNKNAQNMQQQFYRLLKESNLPENKLENINNYYYYYLNN